MKNRKEVLKAELEVHIKELIRIVKGSHLPKEMKKNFKEHLNKENDRLGKMISNRELGDSPEETIMLLKRWHGELRKIISEAKRQFRV